MCIVRNYRGLQIEVDTHYKYVVSLDGETYAKGELDSYDMSDVIMLIDEYWRSISRSLCPICGAMIFRVDGELYCGYCEKYYRLEEDVIR